MPRFLVTGASGLLGLNFSLRAAIRNEVVGVVNQNQLHNTPFQSIPVDLLANDQFIKKFEEINPDILIHCAAMANLDTCEKYPEQAYLLNAEIPGKLAYFCKKNGIKFVHISTDAVFDGKKGGYSEIDKPEPLSMYAQTKKAGEDQVLQENSDAIIARVNFFGWSINGNRSLSEFFYNNLKSSNPINGFIDVHFCPLYVSQLSDLIIEMIKKDLSGIYHVVSSDHMSKYQFGCSIAEKFGFDSQLIQPISVLNSDLIAERSKDLTLSTEKLSFDLGKQIPSIQDGINLFYDDYHNGFAGKIRSFVKDFKH